MQKCSWKKIYLKNFTDNCRYSSVIQYQYVTSGHFSAIRYNEQTHTVSIVCSYCSITIHWAIAPSEDLLLVRDFHLSDSLKGLRHGVPQTAFWVPQTALLHKDCILPLLFLKCTWDFVFIQFRRQLPLKRQLVTSSSQEQGAHHAGPQEAPGSVRRQNKPGRSVGRGLCGGFHGQATKHPYLECFTSSKTAVIMERINKGNPNWTGDKDSYFKKSVF